MPTAEQVKRAAAAVERLRERHHGEIVIDAVVPDYYARLPKPCVGGWGRRSLNVTPEGKVLPCHAAETHSRPRILVGARAFARRHLGEFAGLQRLPRHRLDAEPCRSCARREIDFGGCRCQAFALTGDARATDPVCHLAPGHDDVAALAAVRDDAPYVYRRM